MLGYAGEKGFGITQTCHPDRYPKGLNEYLHHEVVDASNAWPQDMWFENPIVAVKQVAAMPTTKEGTTTKPYTKTLVFFQSTGATNIIGVNSLPSASLYATVESRGIKPNKRYWGIKQNEARATYLGHYYGVNNVDHMIKMQRYATQRGNTGMHPSSMLC